MFKTFSNNIIKLIDTKQKNLLGLEDLAGYNFLYYILNTL